MCECVCVCYMCLQRVLCELGELHVRMCVHDSVRVSVRACVCK